MNSFKYSGSELEIFSQAQNFKQYYFDLAKNYLFSTFDVLEVGAGIGSQTQIFSSKITFKTWTCLEPDLHNIDLIQDKYTDDNRFVFVPSTLVNFVTDKRYDLIILADVLEHIPNDSSALEHLVSLLAPNGILLIYVPACQFLYSDFDASIGHFRRYSSPTLNYVIPKSVRIETLKYFDSLGWFLSFANKLILRSSTPSLRQVLFWDRVLLPVSIFLDKIIDYRFGKNIFCVVKNV